MEKTNSIDDMMSFSNFLEQKYGEKAPKIVPEKTTTQNLAKLLPPEKRATAEIAGEVSQAAQQELPFGETDKLEVVSKAVARIQSIVESLVQYNERRDKDDQEKERLSKSWGELKPIDLVNIKKFTQNAELSPKALEQIKKLIKESSNTNPGAMESLLGMLPGASSVAASVVPQALKQGGKVLSKVPPSTAARVGGLARFLPSPVGIAAGAAVGAIAMNTDRIREYRKDLEANGVAQHREPDIDSIDKLAQPNATVGKQITSIDKLALNPATKKYKELFIEAGQKYGVDPDLLASQVYQESRGNPNAVSSKGAKGLAQFMLPTAKQYGVDVKDPRSSIDGQARYMRDLLAMFSGDINKALAAYNAGPGNIKKAVGLYGTEWLENLHYVTGESNAKQTRDYVNKIQGKASRSYTYTPVKAAKPTASPVETPARKSASQSTVKPYDYRTGIDQMIKESEEKAKQKTPAPIIMPMAPQQSQPSNIIQDVGSKGNLSTRNPNSNLQLAQVNELRRIR